MTPTATPEETGRPTALRWAVPLAVLVIAAVVAAAVLVTRDGGDGGGSAAPPSTSVPPDAVEVTSDAPAFASLQELAGASDLIVRGHVTSTARGRRFGDPGGSAIESRLVRLRVDEVLRGTLPEGEQTVLVEEEGWTEDGRPLVVDGARPTQEGDAGIWFLTATGDDTSGSWIVVNAQGRYLQDGDELVGAEGDDPLVADLSAGSVDDLADRISRTPPGP